MTNRKKRRPSKKAHAVEIQRSELAAPVGKPVDPGPSGLGRRDFLKLSLTAAGVGLAAPMMFVRKASAQGGERVLKVVQWKHFVPDYDKYFDIFAREFGDKHNAKVEVDYVATADLPTAIAADISRGGGHDVAHSSDAPQPHGSSTPTSGAYRQVRHTLIANGTIDRPSRLGHSTP